MVTTNDSTSLTARFDMLFSPPMKKYVKENGGGAYVRELVLNDILLKLNSAARQSLTANEERRVRMAYEAELNSTQEEVA